MPIYQYTNPRDPRNGRKRYKKLPEECVSSHRYTSKKMACFPCNEGVKTKMEKERKKNMSVGTCVVM